MSQPRTEPCDPLCQRLVPYLSMCHATGKAKRRYPSADAAVNVTVKLMASETGERSRRVLNVFFCPSCNGWHIGHRPSVVKPRSGLADVEKASAPPDGVRCACACNKPAIDNVTTPKGVLAVCARHGKRLRATYTDLNSTP